MKKFLIITFIAALILNACNPVYDPAPNIGNPPTAKIKIVGQVDPNHIILTAETDNGFIYYWDFGTGVTSTQQTDTAYYPFAKDYTVKLIVSGKGGTAVDSTTITITQNDPAIGTLPGIKELTNQGQGRTWVFAKDNCDPAGSFFYMTAGYDWTEFWWDPVPDNCCNTAEVADDSIRFDLEGDFNYTLYHNGEETKGTFVYDDDAKTIKLINANLPYCAQNGGLLNPDAINTGLYEVKALNDTILKLWQNQAISGDYSYGWTWVFKPSGVTYSCGGK